MIVKVSYFIRGLDSADLPCSAGGRRSVPVPGRSSRWRGSHPFPERPADGVRPARGPLHRAGGAAGGDRGHGDQAGVCLSRWEACGGCKSL